VSDKIVDKKIKEFFSKYSSTEYKKGQSILKPGGKVDTIFNIESGYVRSYSVNEEGDVLVINIYKPLNFIPITEALADRVNPYFFEAMTDSVIQKAPLKEVIKFLQSDGDVLFDLARRVSIGLEGFMIRTQYLLRSNATQKITSTIILLSRRFGIRRDDNTHEIILPQTHEDIAGLSGTSRETVSIELAKLKKSKIISTDKKRITVLDFEKLKKLSEIYHEDEPLPYDY
jgi:CRP/FNR family transcriptional regulator